MARLMLKTDAVGVISVRTTFGRLKFRVETEEEALALYAAQYGMTLERLKQLNPRVTKEKVDRPCLVKSESKSSETGSKKSRK